MKLKAFHYHKANGEETDPHVLVLNENDNYLEGIDTTKLDPKEHALLLGVQRQYEKRMKPFVTKAYRRYKKDNIKLLSEDSENGSPE